MPGFITFIAFVLGTLGTAAAFILLPWAVEISETSLKFVKTKQSSYHNFDRNSKLWYYFLKWRAQQMLTVKFGSFFLWKKEAIITYLCVLLNNFTDAIILINP